MSRKNTGEETSGSDELWMFSEADFAKIAELMGCFSIFVNKPSELFSAMDQALASGKQTIVDVKTNLGGIAPQSYFPKD